MRRNILIGLINLGLVVFVLGPILLAGQSAVTGEWTAKTKDKDPGKIHISFERRTEKGGHHQHGTTFSYSDLQGLSADQARNGKVSFRLVREAGTIEAEGTFTDGRGAGTFRFVPNMSFVDAMRSRGFDFEKSNGKGESGLDERLFSAATLNVTTALADDLKAANFGRLGVDDLFKAAIFKVDGKFMAEMKSTGFPNLGMEELVKARIFKIDADFVRQVREMGYAESDFENLVKFRIFKVTPEFLNELKGLGFNDLTSEQVVKFRIFKIDADFIRQARAEDPNITIEGLVERKIGIRRSR